ncbi:MAG: CBS domain-containing protein [Actinomycetota bacterium]|nr:CBS domain-containing protein [Actinomycetota bacterium]
MNLGQSTTGRPDATQTLVESVMTTEVVMVHPGDPIQEAAEKLAKHRITSVPVVDDESRLRGILSDDDLIVEGARLHIPTVFGLLGDVGTWPPSVLRFERELKAAFASKVEDAMSKKVVSCSPKDTVEAAATILHDKKLRMLPVVEDDKVVGVITRTDVMRFLFPGSGE